MKNEGFKSGYVALIGCPNVGKSTLMNRMLGEKLSIVTEKPQTTRNRILGVKTTGSYQILFVDTPGIHRPRHRLNEIMLRTSLAAIEDADVILFLVEPTPVLGDAEAIVIDKLREVTRPILLIINKIDRVRKQDVLPVIDRYQSLLSLQETVPVSALLGDGVDELEAVVCKYLREGPQYFPEDSLTDVSERFMIAEIIREKIILLTWDEIPYAVAVAVEGVQKRRDRDLVDVEAVIYVEKESHRGILVGGKGSRIKEIGTRARPEIEELLGSRIHLSLWVKVKKDWRSRVHMLKDLGYE